MRKDLITTRIRNLFEVPMLHALAFIAIFVIGGLSWIFIASNPVDAFMHDTYFFVGYLHYALFGASLFAMFAAITYWFPKMFGKMMNKTIGRIHFTITFIAFNCAFFPVHILGMGGHMRRIYDPNQYAHLVHILPINTFKTIFVFVLAFGQLIFIFNFFHSLWKGEVV